MNISSKMVRLSVSCFLLLGFNATASEPASDSAPNTDQVAERQAIMAEAQAQLEVAQNELAAALESLTQSRAEQGEGLERMREELSRAHRQLQEASREVARAHRKLMRAEGESLRWHTFNPGDRAVLGIVLGEETEAGLRLVGVSPDGPAERAGLRQDDVLTSIAGVDLTGDGDSRAALFEVMDTAEAGVELPVTASRDGKALNLVVVPEQREPSSWQSVIHLPDHPHVAGLAPEIHIKTLKVPEFDEEEWAARIEEFNKKAQEFEYRFSGDDGVSFVLPDEIEVDDVWLSALGENAVHEANMWFGVTPTRGLELASLNPGLGKYFKADSGVLVIEAREDNAYGLQSGDVIQSVNAVDVNSPADFLRALRDAKPGAELELAIKRNRREQTLKAIVPENRLGKVQLFHPPHTSAAALAPAAPGSE